MKPPLFVLFLACLFSPCTAEIQADARTSYEQGVALRESDPGSARQAFERAEKEGDPRAAVQLGILHANGTGTLKDDAKAYSYFAKAAASGQREGLFNQGLFLLEGRGAPRDLKGGIAALTAAAAAGSIPAHVKLADLYYFGAEGLEKSYPLALPHVEAAAASGDAWACNILGTMAEMGQAMKVDRLAARHWFTQAAVQGNAKAQGNLGRLLRGGKPSHHDKVESFKWLKLSSLQGISMSTYQLELHRRSMTAAQIAEAERAVLEFNNRRGKDADASPRPRPTSAR
jgi:TPR repeat protein